MPGFACFANLLFCHAQPRQIAPSLVFPSLCSNPSPLIFQRFSLLAASPLRNQQMFYLFTECATMKTCPILSIWNSGLRSQKVPLIYNSVCNRRCWGICRMHAVCVEFIGMYHEVPSGSTGTSAELHHYRPNRGWSPRG